MKKQKKKEEKQTTVEKPEKKKNDLYFGEEVTKSIVALQKESDQKLKHKIFEKDIMPAFDKLIKYHYFKIPVKKDPEVLHDCMSFLYEQLNKFNATQHDRGFPYFNVIVKNYFIQKLKTEEKKNLLSKEMDSLNDPKEIIKNNKDYLTIDNIEDAYDDEEFVRVLKENLPKWRDSFSKDQEKSVVDALVVLFENVENFDNYNRKIIYFYIKEITGLNTKQIAINLNKIKKKFKFFKKKYQKGTV
jgi:hypothetical protein